MCLRLTSNALVAKVSWYLCQPKEVRRAADRAVFRGCAPSAANARKVSTLRKSIRWALVLPLILSATASAVCVAATTPTTGTTVKPYSTLADPGFFRDSESRASRSEVRLPLTTVPVVATAPGYDDRQADIVYLRQVRHDAAVAHAKAVRAAKLHAAAVKRAKALAAKRAAERRAHYTAPISVSGIKAYAESLVGASQFRCLDTLWNRESGWRVHAENTSGAYGIPQALPGSKMGPGWQDNAEVQVRWGVGYIHARYGDACGALAHSDRYGWY